METLLHSTQLCFLWEFPVIHHWVECSLLVSYVAKIKPWKLPVFGYYWSISVDGFLRAESQSTFLHWHNYSSGACDAFCSWAAVTETSSRQIPLHWSCSALTLQLEYWLGLSPGWYKNVVYKCIFVMFAQDFSVYGDTSSSKCKYSLGSKRYCSLLIWKYRNPIPFVDYCGLQSLNISTTTHPTIRLEIMSRKWNSPPLKKLVSLYQIISLIRLSYLSGSPEI